MVAKPSIRPAADSAHTPVGFTDYVVRFLHPTMFARTQLYRAASEAAAMELALADVRNARLDGWRIQDVMTVDEAIARRGGRRG